MPICFELIGGTLFGVLSAQRRAVEWLGGRHDLSPLGAQRRAHGSDSGLKVSTCGSSLYINPPPRTALSMLCANPYEQSKGSLLIVRALFLA